MKYYKRVHPQATTFGCNGESGIRGNDSLKAHRVVVSTCPTNIIWAHSFDVSHMFTGAFLKWVPRNIHTPPW